MKVRVVISGRSYDAAESIPEYLTLSDGSSVDDALRALAERFPEGRPLPESCLIAVSGSHLGTLRSHTPRQLEDGDELVLIAPVAGG
jgi:molybdopterin converting factor small subunit